MEERLIFLQKYTRKIHSSYPDRDFSERLYAITCTVNEPIWVNDLLCVDNFGVSITSNTFISSLIVPYTVRHSASGKVYNIDSEYIVNVLTTLYEQDKYIECNYIEMYG